MHSEGARRRWQPAEVTRLKLRDWNYPASSPRQLNADWISELAAATGGCAARGREAVEEASATHSAGTNAGSLVRGIRHRLVERDEGIAAITDPRERRLE